jgi:hypothetical protein
MGSKKRSSGGKAEAAGGNYETLVAAWYCSRILLSRVAPPLFDLPATSRILNIRCQSDEPVDDVVSDTSDSGKIFVQAKRSVTLSDKENSPLGKTLKQFVQQYRAWTEPGDAVFVRRLDATRDRLVLATRGGQSRKIVETLPRMLRALRDRSHLNLLSEVQTSEAENAVALIVEAQIKKNWISAYGREPSDSEIGSLLRFVWVQTLDVEEGERDRADALGLMRASLLADAAQADSAFSELVKLCGRLRAERSGADIPGLLSQLTRVGIVVMALPEYRQDIEALRRWTQVQVQKSPRFTYLLEAWPNSVVERELWPIFRREAVKESFLVVGDPGSGKSGLTYRLAQDLVRQGVDVVFVPVDILNVDGQSQLQRELGISRQLADVLQNWPGAAKGVLIVDALDAARKFETQTVLREAIDQVRSLAGNRWNVVASVRKYDLRHGTDWRRTFRGRPVSNDFTDKEFSFVRHVSVNRLSDQEIAQTTVFSPQLNQLFREANPQLAELLRNIFNLHLLAELIAHGTVAADLKTIQTQSELLETYWQHRIHRNDGKHDSREIALTATVREMIAKKSLRVFRADVRDQVDAAALVDLERNDILRAEQDLRGANEDILLFSHHVLFDYAVARLLFRRGRDPARLVELLRADRALTLMVGPSLTLALRDAWGVDAAHAAFWELAFAIASETSLPQAAYLAAPMVAAESATTLADVGTLLRWLDNAAPERSVAERIMQRLCGAILVCQKAGAPIAGPYAGPWINFSEAMSALGTDAAMFAANPLVAISTEKPQLLTAGQLEAAGVAARRLLEFGWSRERRPGNLIINAIGAVSVTIGSDVEATSRLLHRLIELDHLKAHGYEELRWIAQHIKTLSQFDATLVVDIYQAAYGYLDEGSDEKTNIGNSGILSLTSNRRQDYQGAWFQLQEAAPALLEQNPVEGTRAVARALVGYVDRKRRSDADPTPQTERFTLGGKQASYLPDFSYIWYRGGFHEPMDGSALLEKFDAFLLKLPSEANGSSRLQQVVDTLSDEAGLAVLWGSLLVVGTKHPTQFAMAVSPLATALPILSGADTRHQAGQFIEAAYPYLQIAHREEIERAILNVPDDRSKKILAQCVPEKLIATDELREHRNSLRAAGETPANIPPYHMTSSTRPFDTDAYLSEQGVKTDDPVSQAIRTAMKRVEQLTPGSQGPQITLDIAKERLVAINGLRTALEENAQAADGTVIYEHACGTLADAAALTTTAFAEVLGNAEVRRDLGAALLLCADSTNPHFDADLEAKFHEHASWGGPSARTSAARGLICLVRFDTSPDAPILAVIHRLARDPVCHVRYQIAAELHFVHQVDRDWMWNEYQHALLEEPTRSVVDAALRSLGQAAPLDLPRVVGLSKAVLSRYDKQTGPGIDTCRTTATSLIVDLYIWGDTPGTREFFSAQMAAFPENSLLLTQWVARYSENLLIGSITDADDKKNCAREKSLDFYRRLLDLSYSEAEQILTRNGLDRVATWPTAEREALQAMFRVIDEITMRIYFAAGAQSGIGSIPDTPERRRFYREIQPLLVKLADVMVVHVAHHVIQTLESFIEMDPPGVFELIAKSVRASEKGGYTMESMGVDVIVRIVERYLADHRNVFADPKRLSDLMDCLDAFVRAGWPAAQALTFRLGEIWR